MIANETGVSRKEKENEKRESGGGGRGGMERGGWRLSDGKRPSFVFPAGKKFGVQGNGPASQNPAIRDKGGGAGRGSADGGVHRGVGPSWDVDEHEQTPMEFCLDFHCIW